MSVLLPLAVVEGFVRDDLWLPGLAVVLGVISVVPLLWRRSNPLVAVLVAFSAHAAGETIPSIAGEESIFVYTGFAYVVLLPYSLFRWGSGRHAALGLGFVIITVLLCAGSLNLTDIVMAQDRGLGLFGWYWLPLFPMFVIFFISMLAETNRPPFDLLEAESELVAGFMVEYSSTPYMLFMLGEYVAIILLCALGTVLFLGGWLPPVQAAPFTWIPGVLWFALKVGFLFFLVSMVKAIVPRYRYDQLMRLGWKVFLPLSLAAVVIVAAVLRLWQHGI